MKVMFSCHDVLFFEVDVAVVRGSQRGVPMDIKRQKSGKKATCFGSKRIKCGKIWQWPAGGKREFGAVAIRCKSCLDENTLTRTASVR